jgi:EAL domain-containing protein (putative c-di-GMP-specific phosphodiesterase class I)
MGILQLWNKLRDRWWGQPIIWSLLLIPLAGWLSPRIMLPEGKVYLIYLPLSICIALLMVYDWRAIPGIAIAILYRYANRLGLEIGVIMTLLYLFCLCVCWLGYRSQTQRRWCAAFGELSLTKARLIWLVTLLPLFFILSLQLVVGLGLMPDETGLMSGGENYLRALVNFQALLLGSMSSIQLFSFILRVLNRPSFALTLWHRMSSDVAPNVKRNELLWWLLVMAGLVFVLCYHAESSTNLLLTDYSLTLLLPVMLYGAMRFGYQLNCMVWSISLIVLFFNYPSYVPQDNLLQNLAFISSLMLVFTLSIFLMSAVNTRQRKAHQKVQMASLKDPVVGLPNLRALKQDLGKAPRSTLCFLRISELDLLSRNYGMQLRIRFKQQLAAVLEKALDTGEGVYHLPGYDLVLRLNGYDAEDKVTAVYHSLEKFRLVWNGLPIHPPIGVSYCGIYSEVGHLNVLLGELSSLAEVSLSSGKPENIQNDHRLVQDEIKRKVALLHWVQRSLDNDSFVLLAQPIAGIRGDRYHEVLLRMLDDEEQIVPPDEFLPVVHEFGLAYQLDLWVLRHTLIFMDSHRDNLPSVRFAVNLSPSSLCRPTLVRDVRKMLEQYSIESYQLVLEVTESHLMQDSSYADISLQELRELGCRIAIDDFGTGYASYDRLRTLQVDTLKIDGSFVRDMLTNPVDYQIIVSICKVALMKRLTIVAEYVESREQYDALKGLGVDYMQGYFVGKPVPLEELLVG